MPRDRCAKCNYDLSATLPAAPTIDATRCPECGYVNTPADFAQRGGTGNGRWVVAVVVAVTFNVLATFALSSVFHAPLAVCLVVAVATSILAAALAGNVATTPTSSIWWRAFTTLVGAGVILAASVAVVYVAGAVILSLIHF